jgi:L,D-transpeptidase catalytic domain
MCASSLQEPPNGGSRILNTINFSDPWLRINVLAQQLEFWHHFQLVFSLPCATARNGLGEVNGSEKTPRGWHAISQVVGAHAPPTSVFVGRKATGEQYSKNLVKEYPDRDWILSRILWLEGLEQGFNRGGQCDSKQRYIYIHGSPESGISGKPTSRGCIRLKIEDILALTPQCFVGMRVLIDEGE